MKVETIPEVKQYLNDLITILFEKEYFGFEENAKKYVDELLNDIITNLPTQLKREAPKYFTDRYGEGLYYSVFSKSKRTQWYVFFRIYRKDKSLYYQVRYIANNHTIAQFLTFNNK